MINNVDGCPLIPGYRVKPGSRLDRAILVKFMQRTYEELYPNHDFAHLAQTVDQYLVGETQLWWVISDRSGEQSDSQSSTQTLPFQKRGIMPDAPVGCLWMGNAIDQVEGDRHTHIFLLYVVPQERRKGIGTALMQRAEAWAQHRGDRQIGLQVFQANERALSLYQALGYTPKSIWMTKPLN